MSTNATQISSDMMFNNKSANSAAAGNQSNENTYTSSIANRISDTNLDEYKEAASKVVNRVGEKASELKNQAVDWFSTFTSQQ